MDFVDMLIRFLVIVPAIVFHEVAHGYAALLLGDTTARDAGRLSLNPLRHIDPFGTILLPLILTALFGVGFGYAKPVPVNPYRFRVDYRRGMLVTGVAGPAANLLMAAASGLVVRVLTPSLDGGLLVWVATGAYLFALMNLALMFFNLIPVPPLDGSRVLPLFLSDRAMRAYHKWERYGFLVLFGLLWFAPEFLRFDPLGAYLEATVYPLLRLLTGIA